MHKWSIHVPVRAMINVLGKFGWWQKWLHITKTCPCNITEFLSEAKIENFVGKKMIFFLYLCSKHTLWVHVRTEAVLTSTHSLCFGKKNKKNRYTPAFFLHKSGVQGGILFMDMIS